MDRGTVAFGQWVDVAAKETCRGRVVSTLAMRRWKLPDGDTCAVAFTLPSLVMACTATVAGNSGLSMSCPYTVVVWGVLMAAGEWHGAAAAVGDAHRQSSMAAQTARAQHMMITCIVGVDSITGLFFPSVLS